MARNVVIFGATGSIGNSTIEVIRRHRDKFNIVGIAANRNVPRLAAIACEFGVKNIGVFDRKFLQGNENLFISGTKFFSSQEGFCELAGLDSADAIVMAIGGLDGLFPTIRAIEHGKNILLATKDILVVAGKFIINKAKACGAKILPIDSEHNAIFQCIEGHEKKFINRLILTASGGPFKNFSPNEMAKITVEQALKHPTWNMGTKNTIDSATMANKGLEMIEARWLFDMPIGKIDAIVHPESIIHSMVEFCDGSVIAQMSPTSMQFPIANCLFYPNREKFSGDRLQLPLIGDLRFEDIDDEKFPLFLLARRCCEKNDNSSAVYQAANEVAVEKFLQRKLRFLDIHRVVMETLASYSGEKELTLENCLHSANQARLVANSIAQNLKN